MDLLFVLSLSFSLLLLSILKGYFIAYPLLISMIAFILMFRFRGFPIKELIRMALNGSKKSFPVLIILLLIGVVTAVWIAAGTVPALVYYGMKFINPHCFILAAFVLSSLISLLTGTSFGTVGTIGIALMIMSKGSAVNPDVNPAIEPHIVAGAIIAGAYFGDRCSPMSSSAHLIATITKTDLYRNLTSMMLTGFVPLIVSCLLYLILSLIHPVQVTGNLLAVEISRLFDLNLIVLLPALMLMGFAIVRVEVKLSMGISIAVSVAIALLVQHYSGLQILKFAIAGFMLEENTPIRPILLGGGLASMAKVCVVVIISTAISGILAETNALQIVENLLKRVQSRSSLFLTTTLIGTVSAALGCTQTIAILLTQQLVAQKYQASDAEKGCNKLAIDLENTTVVLAPLIPWNIAGFVPATLLMTDAGFIPYAFYLYLIPLLNLLGFWLGNSKKHPPKNLKFMDLW